MPGRRRCVAGIIDLGTSGGHARFGFFFSWFLLDGRREFAPLLLFCMRYHLISCDFCITGAVVPLAGRWDLLTTKFC